MIEFKLPSLGADMDQGKLLEWKVKAGDKVRRGDIMAVVDTTKAAVEIEIWEEGTVHELIVKPGEKIPVGTVMALLLAPGETPETALRPKLAPVRPAVARSTPRCSQSIRQVPETSISFSCDSLVASFDAHSHYGDAAIIRSPGPLRIRLCPGDPLSKGLIAFDAGTRPA